MEVVPLTVPRRSDPTVGIPFSKRNVEEWSRLDRLTGMMETAKIETDHWSARSSNAAHKYGRMVDSRERNNQDGTLHETQRKQMEVFQTQVPGGSMQVIRTQTVTTSSKSSKWTSGNDKVFSDLQLPINSLDLSSQKTKGSVGRSGSIGGRRPPSRPRSLIGQSTTTGMFGEESSVSKLCHQIHEKAKSDLFRGTEMNGFLEEPNADLVITDVTDKPPANTLFRRKSCSNENVANDGNDEDEDSLRRSSKVRRSLQFPKSQPENEELEWSGGKSLKERAAEIENLLKHGGSTVSLSSTFTRDQDTAPESDKSTLPKRKDSFVTADTLKEVRDKLKKSNLSDPDQKDDGIEEGDPNQSRVKCFVYGMEAVMANGKASVNGTGSLESRSSCRNSLNGTRTAEWYRRRKSYGFEDVDESDKFGRFSRKGNIESSTDSGICQSSETVGTPSWGKSKTETFRTSPVSTVVTVGLRKDSKQYQPFGSKVEEKSVNSVYLDNPTTCSIRVEEPKKETHWKFSTEPYGYNSPWNRKSPISQHKNNEIKETLKSSLSKNPWISQLKGTKLVDRDWTADEQETNEETKSALLKKDTESGSDGTQKKSKKVEFCKTEVHFAAESGKFNIVETDGKPPPNDIFRRRRRVAPVHKNPNGLPETKFGDSMYEKRLLSSEKTESISKKIEAELKELSKIVIDALPQAEEPNVEIKKPNARLYDVLEEDAEDSKTLWPRSILKNNAPSFLSSKPPSPRPGGSPIPPSPQVWKSTVILRNRRYDNVRKFPGDEVKPYSSDGENELQVRIRNLRKTDPKWWEPPTSTNNAEMKRRSLPDDALLKPPEIAVSGDEMPTLSVAERVKKVEEMKSNNYSSKINFQSGEMTVIQNGNEGAARDEEKKTWQKVAESAPKDRATISCDNKSTSNPPVMRFSANKDDKTDSQKYQTTRILINFQSSSQGDSETPKRATATEAEKPKPNSFNKPPPKPVNSYWSWSPGMKKDFNRYFNDLKSTTLVKETIQSAPEDQDTPEDFRKPSKSVHEIIDQFDSLTRKTAKDKRRKTMPINYKAPKEYTQEDLEEELKNFTENLDKDFRDIYEEEIGSMRKKSQEKTEKMIQPVLVSSPPKSYVSVRSASSEVSSQKTSSRLNYDSDDSDLLADEEVRSYMSAGQGGTDSDAEEAYGSCGSRKSFEDYVHYFRELETKRKKEIKSEVRPVKSSFVRPEKPEAMNKPEQKNIASIALKYEDDPLFSARNFKPPMTASKPPLVNGFKEDNDPWEKVSNSSSTKSKKQERNSYLNVLSLSEKYSKYLERSSNSSLDNIPEYKSEVRRSPDSMARREHDLEGRRVSTRYGAPIRREPEERKTTNPSLKGYAAPTEMERAKQRVMQLESSRSRGTNHAEKKRVSHHVERRTRSREKPEAILDELTRAADQILVAVNDYDDDSHPASSEDDDRSRRVIRRSKMGNLGTISEGKRVTKTETRRSSAVTNGKRTVGTQSSASSLESLTRESIRPGKQKVSETSKTMSSRATRLLQRASTRQASMPQPSSSEDLPSYIELAKKRSLRRQRSSASVKSSEGEAKAIRTKVRSRTAEAPSAPRTRDRRSEKAKESTIASRSVKTSVSSCRPDDTERHRSSGRRSGAEKLDDTTRKKRIHHLSTGQDSAAPTALLRKKPSEKWKP